MDHSPPGYSVHDSLGKNTGMGCDTLLQGIFLTQGLNLCLLHWLLLQENLPDPGMEPASLASPASQAGSLQLSHRGCPPQLLNELLGGLEETDVDVFACCQAHSKLIGCAPLWAAASSSPAPSPPGHCASPQLPSAKSQMCAL